ncbi:hypothetical protein Q9K09_26420, partial [Klebsiella pneumoniae subsp. pneumoniae]|nr:hypothetical protein [Klebsiella pneumoniae subsp. pneumoniae]
MPDWPLILKWLIAHFVWFEPVDPRKAAVEAAIARAKARKAEQQAAPVEAPAVEPVDPRKAAVEAA